MTGTTMEELYESLSTGHEIVFLYHGSVYSLEPDNDGISSYVTIWSYGEPATCLARCEITDADKQHAIDVLLQIPCFDGHSFMQIENEVTIDVIY